MPLPGLGTVSSIGSAVNDLFAADAHRAKAKGLGLEATNYDRASEFSTQNEKFTEQSTAIKQSQLDRSNYLTIGGQAADVAGAGFAASGSALDIMRDSAGQGALTKAVGAEQGLIAEEGYKVQAESYTNMAAAARVAQNAENNAAKGSEWAAIFHGAAAVASLFPGGSAAAEIVGQAAGSAMGDPTGIGGLY